MAEIFTISGAGNSLGQTGCPTGWTTTPKGNCGAPGPSPAPAAVKLQNALKALGRTVGDPVLRDLAADGYIGPSTTGAVNRAFTTHVGPGQAPAQFRTGNLSIYQVASGATALTSLIEAEVTRRGGAVPSPTAPVTATATTPAATKRVITLPPEYITVEGPRTRALRWGLLGLGLVAAGTGAYFAFGQAAPPVPAREAVTRQLTPPHPVRRRTRSRAPRLHIRVA